MTDPHASWASFASTSLRSWAASEGVELTELARINAMINGPGRQTAVNAGSLQCPDLNVPGLTASPWHDPSACRWTADIEASFEVIKSEALALRSTFSIDMHNEAEKLALAGEWRRYDLMKLGIPLPDAKARCPKTLEAIMAVSEITEYGAVYFAIAVPGTSIRPHYGPHNARLRTHLGLQIPPGCWLDVASDKRTWTEGRCIVFDDSFVHSVGHEGTGERIVMIFDVWHPDLTPVERGALTFLLRDLPLTFPEIRQLDRVPTLFGGEGL